KPRTHGGLFRFWEVHVMLRLRFDENDRLQLGSKLMNHAIRFLILVPVLCAFVMTAAINVAHAESDQIFVKGKFAMPADREKIIEGWKARGYPTAEISEKQKGWSRSNSYKENCVSTVLSGRVEYVINGKTYIAEPGDEVYHPANVKHTATNLSDGMSVVLVGTH
ncbi:unnamed protein product, partial [marine sediment metagenome]